METVTHAVPRPAFVPPEVHDVFYGHAIHDRDLAWAISTVLDAIALNPKRAHAYFQAWQELCEKHDEKMRRQKLLRELYLMSMPPQWLLDEVKP